jgi:hypothetical protein
MHSEDGIEKKDIQELQNSKRQRLPGEIEAVPLKFKFRFADPIVAWQEVVSNCTRLQLTYSGDLARDAI